MPYLLFRRSNVISMALCLQTLTSCSYFQSEDLPIACEPIECTEEPIDICVKMTDKRWCKEGGYGMANVTVYLKKDLALLLKEPIFLAFEGNNLCQAESGVAVEIEVEQFFCDVREHRCSWNCMSELIFNVKVISSKGEEFYSRRISGIAENDFDINERNGKARRALDAALADAMRTLLEDRGFRRALRKAAAQKEEPCSNPPKE